MHIMDKPDLSDVDTTEKTLKEITRVVREEPDGRIVLSPSRFRAILREAIEHSYKLGLSGRQHKKSLIQKVPKRIKGGWLFGTGLWMAFCMFMFLKEGEPDTFVLTLFVLFGPPIILSIILSALIIGGYWLIKGDKN